MSGAACDLKGRIVEAALKWRRDAGALEDLALAVDELLGLPSSRFVITKHATERFRTRSGNKTQPLDLARQKVADMLDRATEVELKPNYRVISLPNHGFKDARYFKFSDWILVVAGNAVVTCYRDTAGRWR